MFCVLCSGFATLTSLVHALVVGTEGFLGGLGDLVVSVLRLAVGCWALAVGG